MASSQPRAARTAETKYGRRCFAFSLASPLTLGVLVMRWDAADECADRLTYRREPAGQRVTPRQVHDREPSPVLWPGRGGDEVVAETDQARLGLGHPGGEQDLLAALRVGPLLPQRPARALDPVAGHAGEPGAFDLAGQPVRGVEVSGGEELR